MTTTAPSTTKLPDDLRDVRRKLEQLAAEERVNDLIEIGDRWTMTLSRKRGSARMARSTRTSSGALIPTWDALRLVTSAGGGAVTVTAGSASRGMEIVMVGAPVAGACAGGRWPVSVDRMTQPCPVATTAAGSHKRACDCRRSSSSESSSSRGSLRRISRLRPVPVRPPAGARPCAGNPTAGDAVSVVVRRQVRGASSWGSGISRPAKAASTALRRYAAGSIPTSFALSSSE